MPDPRNLIFKEHFSRPLAIFINVMPLFVRFVKEEFGGMNFGGERKKGRPPFIFITRGAARFPPMALRAWRPLAVKGVAKRAASWSSCPAIRRSKSRLVSA